MFRSIPRNPICRAVCFGLALLLLPVASCLVVLSLRAAPVTGRVLLLADIHFDPLAHPTVVAALDRADVSQWPRILAEASPNPLSATLLGQDTDYDLFQSSLAAAADQKPYDFVLLIGDYLRHSFKAAFEQAGGNPDDFPSFAVKTADFVLDSIQDTFGVPVYLALGNNDSTCADYGLEANGPLLQGLAGSAKVFIDQPQAAASFSLAGYYTLPHPTLTGDEIIVLNSVLWSRKSFICESPSTDLGDSEMEWLEGRLAAAAAANHKVTIVTHIPPGVDAFYTSRSGAGKAPVEFWRDAYLSRFSELMQKYSATVRIVFAAHIHRDDFRVLSGPNATAAVAVRIVPSISPIYRNNPAFTVLNYDPSSGELAGTTTYFLDLNQTREKAAWTLEYNFPNAYGYDRITPQNLAAVAMKLRADSQVRQLYVRYYTASAPGEIDATNWPYFTCAETEVTVAGYSKALHDLLGQVSPSGESGASPGQ